MTVSNAADLMELLPSKINELVEMGNRGYGLTKRILRSANLNIEYFEEVMEITKMIVEIWRQVDLIWRSYENENGENPGVIEQLDLIGELVKQIEDISGQGNAGLTTEKNVLRLLKEYLNELTRELTLL